MSTPTPRGHGPWWLRLARALACFLAWVFFRRGDGEKGRIGRPNDPATPDPQKDKS